MDAGSDSARRRWLVRHAGLRLGVAAHGALAALFAVLGLVGPAAASVAAALLFGGLVAAHRRGYALAVATIAGVEANLHLGWLAWVLGPDSGAALLLLPIALASFVANAHRTVWPALAWSLVPVAVFFGVTAFPGEAAALSPAFAKGLFLANAAIAFVGVVGMGFHLQVSADRIDAELGAERQRQRNLIESLMPAPIAARWLAGERHIADLAPDATVVFADIVGFTTWSAGQPPADVLATLERLFARFDALADAHGVEKVKTIGDSYMAMTLDRAGTARAVRFASDLQDAVHDVRTRTGLPLDLRIGVHAGPVVAGLLGQHRFQYDLFGDVVNVASRLESRGVVGGVQVSEAVRQRVAGVIPVRGEGPAAAGLCLAPRGEVELRGRGKLAVYLVERAG